MSEAALHQRALDAAGLVRRTLARVRQHVQRPPEHVVRTLTLTLSLSLSLTLTLTLRLRVQRPPEHVVGTLGLRGRGDRARVVVEELVGMAEHQPHAAAEDGADAPVHLVRVRVRGRVRVRVRVRV